MAAPAQADALSQPPRDQNTLYTSFAQYPFSSDADFQNGLSSILGHPETPPTQAEISSNHDLVLQAQCFYYARKFGTPPIDPVAYKAFLTSTSTSNSDNDSSTEPTLPPTQAQGAAQPTVAAQPAAQPNGTATAQPDPAQPPYPPTFAEIVDLITSNKPIPGIETIPETVLEPGSSKTDHTSRRRKPWETNTETPVDDDIFGNGGSVRSVGETSVQSEGADGARTDAGARRSEGVIRILQPDAIPDSGLIAKD